MYVFVSLNTAIMKRTKARKPVQYFIVPGDVLKDQPEQFGEWFLVPKNEGGGIIANRLRPFEDNWKVFGVDA